MFYIVYISNRIPSLPCYVYTIHSALSAGILVLHRAVGGFYAGGRHMLVVYVYIVSMLLC